MGKKKSRYKYFSNYQRLGAGRVPREWKILVGFLKNRMLIQGLEEIHMIKHPSIHILRMTIEFVFKKYPRYSNLI